MRTAASSTSASPAATATRSSPWTARQRGLRGRVPQDDGLRGHRHDPLPPERRRQPRPDGRQHAAPGRAPADQPEAPIVATGHGAQELPSTPRCAMLAEGRRRGHQGVRRRYITVRYDSGEAKDYQPDQVPALQPRHLHQPAAHRQCGRAGGDRRRAGRRPLHRPAARSPWARTSSWAS